MNQLLLDRSTGNLSPRAFARLQTSYAIHATTSAPHIRFNGGEKEIKVEGSSEPLKAGAEKIWAHQFGASAIAIDIDRRFLVSGGADSSIRLWDLDEYEGGSQHIFQPRAAFSNQKHKFGITHLSFYPFDSGAFLSSSYDHHLKLYATETLEVSAEFDLNSVVYTHALSPIADHLLVACATQHPALRLVDLRTGSTTHSLAGHQGALLAVAWNPAQAHILASGSVDGTVRLWDVRKSSGSLGILDMEDSTGITGTDGLGRSARARNSGKTHDGAVNAISWTDDGAYIITAGHDDRVRVFDAVYGANTLASFGPTIKNRHLSALPLVVTPTQLTQPGQELLFFPNENEILVFELHEGRLLKRLKVPGPNTAAIRARTGERSIKNRITGMIWRGQIGGLYSTHTDGQIRAWVPRTAEDEALDQEEEDMSRSDADGNDGAQRKRKVLDDVFKSLTKQKITFG